MRYQYSQNYSQKPQCQNFNILKDDCKILNIDGDINSCLNEQKYECLNKELYSLS